MDLLPPITNNWHTLPGGLEVFSHFHPRLIITFVKTITIHLYSGWGWDGYGPGDGGRVSARHPATVDHVSGEAAAPCPAWLSHGQHGLQCELREVAVSPDVRNRSREKHLHQNTPLEGKQRGCTTLLYLNCWV